MSANQLPCPCAPDRQYSECCQPYHQHQAVPPTPQILMRARYTAFALNKLEYLRQTWHPATCPADLGLDDNPQWIDLEIVSAGIHKYPRHHLGHVHFRATCRDANNNVLVLEERSRFEKLNGCWLYLDGKNTFSKID